MSVRRETVALPVDGGVVHGDLDVPEGAVAVVVFAHGSGSSRFSPRNRYVADVLQQAGLATLLMDLLTDEEERIDVRTAAFRFDIPRLAARLVLAIDALAERRDTALWPVGLFGASTGAAAALEAAAARPERVGAIVGRGGRPDLAVEAIPQVRAPTLLIVGERDPVVLELNRRVLPAFRAPARLVVVPGASHLFEEPGKLDEVAALARDWFLDHLGPRP